MNEQLQAALAQLIAMVTSGAQALYEFGAEQVPVVLQQLLLWHAVESLVYFISSLLLLVSSLYCCVSPYRPGRHMVAHLFAELRDDGTVREIYPTIFLPIMGLGFGLMGLFLNLDWLKIWLAPNLYLLEYAARLVN